jgi:hypothetical protein
MESEITRGWKTGSWCSVRKRDARAARSDAGSGWAGCCDTTSGKRPDRGKRGSVRPPLPDSRSLRLTIPPRCPGGKTRRGGPQGRRDESAVPTDSLVWYSAFPLLVRQTKVDRLLGWKLYFHPWATVDWRRREFQPRRFRCVGRLNGLSRFPEGTLLGRQLYCHPNTRISRSPGIAKVH